MRALRTQHLPAQLDQLPLLRSGKFGGESLSGSGGQFHQNRGDLAGRDRPGAHLGYDGDRARRSGQDLAGELVELGCPEHCPRRGAALDEAFLDEFAGVIASR